MTLVALIRAPPVIERILCHLAQPTDVPRLRPPSESPAGRGQPDKWNQD